MLESLGRLNLSKTSISIHSANNIANTTSSSTGSSHQLRSSPSMTSSTSSVMKSFVVEVVFLDDSSHIFELDKRSKGTQLLQSVFDHLELEDRAYFGLIFNENGGTIPKEGHSAHLTRWLEGTKLVRKQLKAFDLNASTKHGVNNAFNSLRRSQPSQPPILYFRVKFYVADPSRLSDELSRYHIYLQTKKDLLEHRLLAPPSSLCLLTSFVVQAEMGDFEQEDMERKKKYCNVFRDLRHLCINGQSKVANNNALKATQTSTSSLRSVTPYSPTSSTLSADEVDRRIMELHKLHFGQNPNEAELNFLEHARRLDTYGLSLHSGRDSSNKEIQLGVTALGLVVFQNYCSKINTFSWAKIVKISFKRKQFFIQLRKESLESHDTLLGFNLSSYRSCKNLWKSAVDHHAFFRLYSPKPQPKRFFSTLGAKFRHSGRFGNTVQPSSPLVQSSRSSCQLSRTLPHRKTLPLSLETISSTLKTNNKNNTKNNVAILASPETSSIGSSVHSNGNIKSGNIKGVPVNRDVSLAQRAIEGFNHRVMQSFSTKLPKKAWMGDANDFQESNNDDQSPQLHEGILLQEQEGGFMHSQVSSTLGRFAKNSSSSTPSKLALPLSQSNTLGSQRDGKIPSFKPFQSDSGDGKGSPQTKAVKALDALSSTTTSSSLLETGGNSFATMALRSETSKSPDMTNDSLNNEEYEGENKENKNSNEDGLVIITIRPDANGRFGFNVKGGIDQKMPILVSRVGPNTPADMCYPKLNEGDQVVLINGRDVSGHTHAQAVNFIRACSEPHSAELTLAVRPNVYIAEEEEEPDFQYVPESPILSPPFGAKALSQSMLLLEESLQSGAIIGQFEQLYRRNPSMAMTICHLSSNVEKNRYRDISPYDSTRFELTKCPTGDYINANIVDMVIPGSGIINRYLATQGPLSSTCIDFWYMCWESESHLITMLTTIVERGRIKCHKYWPDVGEQIVFDNGLKVLCVKEEETEETFIYRDFELSFEEETRHISQMTYLSWPDHGVPDDSDRFVAFVESVRERRQGSNSPVVVHCSAGIGRTGVLILMETALCLIEANQPVYPLDLTKQMRDQRASMVQTSGQYRFVCQAVLDVYKSARVKPLPEFAVANNELERHISHTVF